MSRTERWHAAKETWCWLVGHRWKSSWRRRSDAAWAMELDEAEERAVLPYARRQSGNPYCEYSAGWHFKCRRCGLRIRSWSWNPWWRDLGWAARSAWDALVIGLTVYWPHRYHHFRWRAWLVSVPCAFWFAWESGYLHWADARNWPMWPGTLLFEPYWRLLEWIERQVRVAPPATTTGASAISVVTQTFVDGKWADDPPTRTGA